MNHSSQNHTPLVTCSPPPDKYSSQIIRINRPTVNSLLHLYGTWTFDCCLLQIKDRYSRSSIIDCKSLKSYVNKESLTLSSTYVRERERKKRNEYMSFLSIRISEQ